jgi:hypothetical protein
VCGCDFNTYQNSCFATISGIVHWVNGACISDTVPIKRLCYNPDSADANQPCPPRYDPVCGCDAIEYANACLARTNGIQQWQNGQCVIGRNLLPTATPVSLKVPSDHYDTKKCVHQDKIDIRRKCPAVHQPVCGCNDHTYQNSCSAQRMGLTAWQPGHCQRKEEK